jgi:hypothetical protein
MSPVNFGSARILVIIGLVVVGVAILVNGFGHGVSTVGATTGGVSPSPSPSVSPTASATPTQTALPSPQQPADVKIAVFNGTSSVGLAAQAQATLTGAGYVKGQEPANSPVEGASKTVVYYTGGADADQNKADAQVIADTYFDGAKVTLLGGAFESQVSKDVQVTIVLGQDYADAHAG